MSLFNPVEVIKKKRNGEVLTSEDIKTFTEKAVAGAIPDYQVSALLMAIYFQGMNFQETAALTRTMITSGQQITFEPTPNKTIKIDKHSTGGIGDKISLILAPLVAALGVQIPMVAGRGLGHTGGTLDKLESIPGFNVNLEIEKFKQITLEHGLAIMGQTNQFVPADKMLYALRDVTATVESIPLITASILSKKAAEGIAGLVLDIKVGSGAFMKTIRQAEQLAKSLVGVGKELGLKVKAVLTDMNQPLGHAIGNSLEVLESIEALKGKGSADLNELTIELGAQMLILSGCATSFSAARTITKKALLSGAGLKKFQALCKAQSSTIDPVTQPTKLPLASQRLEVTSEKTGYISKFNGEEIGKLLIELGGGRKKTTDTIDPSVGFYFHKKIGDQVTKSNAIATIYYNPKCSIKPDEAIEGVLKAITIANKKIQPESLIKKVIG